MSREIGGGWESGNIVSEGFTGLGIGNIGNVAANQHLDRDGQGGTWNIVGAGSSTNPLRNRFQQLNNVRSIVESWIRVEVNQVGAVGDPGYVLAIYNAGTEIGSVRLNPSVQSIGAYMGTATLLATSATGIYPVNRYFAMDVQYRMLDVGGLYNIYIDGVLALTFAGDTKSGADTTYNTIGLGMNGSYHMDEYAMNSITLEYDTLVGGPFLAGETITDGTTGATAVITSVEATVLVLRTWSGVSFGNNNTITGGTSLATALVNAPDANYVSGFQPNSTRIGESFVVAIVPNGVGTTTQLTPTGSGTNWQNVEEVPPNSSDFNSGATADFLDLYAMSSVPSSAVSIMWVGGYNYCQRDNVTFLNQRHIVRTAGVNYFGSNTALATAWAPLWWSWNVNPGTLTAWTVAEVNAVEAGFQVRV
jgi:hypothetical protein